MKVYAKDEKICNPTTMRKRSERLGKADILDEINGFGLDFVKNYRELATLLPLSVSLAEVEIEPRIIGLICKNLIFELA